MKTKRFLGLTALCLSGVMLLCSCGGGTASKGKTKDGKVEIRVAYMAEEMDGSTNDPNEIFAEFYKDNPDITVTIDNVNSSDSKFMAMIAAKNAPDILRIVAVQDIPSFVSKGFLMPLDKYVEKSTVINEDDLFDICDVCRYDGETVGKGSLYAAIKDWSLDTQLWANKKVLAEAGVTLPEDGLLTFEELAEMTNKVTKVGEGGQMETLGLYTGNDMSTLLEWYLEQQGESFWTDDFSGTTLLTSEKTKEALKFFYNWQKNLGIKSTLASIDSMQGWMQKNKLGFTNSGFYLSYFMFGNETMEQNVGVDNVVFLKSPVVDKNKRFSSILSGTAGAISSDTANPDEAYKVWEYIHFGKPAESRAKNMFGMPIQKSNVELLPLDTEQKQKVYETLEDDLKYYTPGQMRVNPYVSVQSIAALFDKYYNPVLYGEGTLEEACERIDAEARKLIEEGKQIVGK